MEHPDNQLVSENCINREQLNWLCEQTLKLNEKNDDLKNMFMEHILKLTNNYINIVENKSESKNVNKDESENNKCIEDLKKINFKLKNENTDLNCENKSLKSKLSKYIDKSCRDIPKKLIKLVNINLRTDIKVCKNTIYNGKCYVKSCPYWHNFNEAYKWSLELERIKRHIRDNQKELGEIERTRSYKRPRE